MSIFRVPEMIRVRHGSRPVTGGSSPGLRRRHRGRGSRASRAPSPQVRIPTEHYDLRWLFRPPRAPPPPAKRLTLLTLRVDLFATPAISAKDSLRVQRAVLLNSPRPGRPQT